MVDCDQDPCDCDTAENGWCFIEMDGGLIGDPVEYIGEFSLPDPQTVVIAID